MSVLEDQLWNRSFWCSQELLEWSINSGTPSQEVRTPLIITHIVYMSVSLYGNT